MQHYSPPPPHITHPGVVVRDVTKEFASAVKKLEPGELVKDDHFTLFEAVSAIEIMDPKMDSGFLEEGESLYVEYDVTRDLLPEEILGIIDQLLCLEMAWHIGYPLSQTLLTSVYIEALLNPTPTNITEVNFVRDPKLRDKQPKFMFILRAYCAGLVKACHLVNERVKEELCYEEEDFTMNTYDRSLLAEVEAAPILDLLQSARSGLRSLRNELSPEMATALDLRLELRVAFLKAIELMGLRNANPDSLKTPWVEMQGILDKIHELHPLGKPVPEAFSTKLQRRLASTMPKRPIVQLTFEETYTHFREMFRDGMEATEVLRYSDTQSLLTFVITLQAKKPQPLLFIRILLQSLLLHKGTAIVGCYSPRQILESDLSLTVLPCGKQLDPSNDYVEMPTDPRHQIAAQMELFRQRVTDPYLDLFRIFCQNRCRVRRALCHSIREWDMLQADAEVVDQLVQVVLDEPSLVTAQQGDIGHQLPLSSWAYLYKLRQMEWIVQLGFELDIYQPEELAGMYWYLSYLAKTRAQHGHRIEAFTTRSLAQARQAAGGRQYTAAKDREFMRSLAYVRATTLDAACTWEFADGLSCLYTALSRVGLHPSGFTSPAPAPAPAPGSESESSSAPPSSDPAAATVPAARPYGDDERRYRVRMKPFAGIGLPALPAQADFRRATEQPRTRLAGLLAYAEAAVAGARRGYEALARTPDHQAFCVRARDRWLDAVRGCLRAAIAAGVAVAALRAAVEEAGFGGGAGEEGVGEEEEEEEDDNAEPVNEGKLDLSAKFTVEIPEPGRGYHDWWIVPKLVPVAAAATGGGGNASASASGGAKNERRDADKGVAASADSDTGGAMGETK